MSRNTEKLNFSTKVKLPSGSGYTPQSLAFINENNRIVICSGTSPNNFIRCSASSYKILGQKADVGHANGGTYCTKNNLIYTSGRTGGSYAYAIDPTTFRVKFTVNLSFSFSGIAYDRITEQFYISGGSMVYVYPYSAFSSSGYAGSCTKSFSKTKGVGAYNGIGAHNGVALVCVSQDGESSQTNYIDCYDANTGSYLKSYYADDAELENVVVDNGGHLHLLFAVERSLKKTTNVFNLKGSYYKAKDPGKIITEGNTAEDNANKVIEIAESYLGQGGDVFWRSSGLGVGQPWCCAFVWSVINEAGFPKCCWSKNLYRVDFCREYMEKESGFKRIYSYTSGNSLDAVKPGDIVITKQGSREDQHVCLARKKGTKDSVETIDGNWGGKVSHSTKPRYSSTSQSVQVVYRPPYGWYASSGSSSGSLVLKTSPEKLYSSQNYKYVNLKFKDLDKTYSDETDKRLSKLIDSWINGGFKPIPDSEVDTKALVSGYLDTSKLSKTKIDSEVSGPSLPIALDPVEAPFVELTIGGYTFGTFKSDGYDKYPNYISGLNVVRTNGSMNEYSIDLIHQIRPGSNPNFIDELLSANGYKKITIKYGDANSGIVFKDSNALLVGVNISFDFVNCNIKYTLKATSSAISIASHKRTFPSTVDKPSNVIKDLLYNDSSEDLLNAFPAMRDRNFVEQNNLIPNNDTVVQLDEFKDINAVSYLKELVSSMKSETDEIVNSTYMFFIENDYFKINEISDKYIYDASLYEVDINFPDRNQVFNFSVDTNYSWPLAYEFSGNISNYNYDITNQGYTKLYSTASSNLLDFTSQMETNLMGNWWTQATEFPISATLTCRGLLSPLLLMTYIKVNSYYYGQKRLTSGVYIVTGQEDTLGGSGYRTTLSLTKVSGPEQHLTVDARVKT